MDAQALLGLRCVTPLPSTLLPPHCGSDQTEWRASAGEGEIYTFTRMVRGVETPYLMAYVRLDEGVTVLTHLHAPDWDAVHIGMRVKLGFSASASGQNVPIFEPTS